MTGDEVLQSKYDRLCVEFKKLRNKYREYRDQAEKEIASLRTFRDTDHDKTLLVSKLKKECAALREQNERLLLEQTNSAKCTVRVTGFENSQVTPPRNESVSFDGGLTPVENSESSFGVEKSTDSVSSACTTLRNVSCMTDTSVSAATTKDSLDNILADLVDALRNWTAAVLSRERTVNLSESNSTLVLRAIKLERQVGEISHNYQLDRERHIMETDKLSSDPSSKGTEESVDVPNSDSDGYEKSLIEWLQIRIHSLTEQAQYFASLVSILQDEIRSIVPRIVCLAREAQYYKEEAAVSHILVEQLQTYLDRTQSNTLKQSNEMASHIANLTDELQQLRGIHSLTPKEPLITVKKNSIFGVLKR
ncbi:unnamed protein product [Dicrocoelium dendriticum]|nr:unnamed protein product [Dicrocoelium dendriticum]